MDHNHQGPEYVHADGDKALLALGTLVFDRECQGIAKHTLTVGERYAMPCFLMFAASFFGSKSADTRVVYAHYAYTSIRPPTPPDIRVTYPAIR